MPKYLVILESPGKIEKFLHCLPKDYEVIASYGHVYDLPEKKLSVDIKKDFEPTFEVIPGKEDVAEKIKKSAKGKDTIYIMTDADFEGFGLGYNIYRFILKDHKNVRRATTIAINKKDILEGIEKSVDINDTINIVDAYETRRILDRLCGYRTSFITQQSTGGKSAGRVQSAGLRVLAEREKEIKNFVPIIYWPVEIELLTKKKEKIVALIKEPKALDIPTEAEALKIISVFKSKPVKVSKYENKNVNISPYPPFTTSTLQQSASSILGFSPDRTMKAAQKCYEAGLTVYHRTDSLNIVPEFISTIRTNIGNNFSKEYLPSSAIFYKTKSKNAQEAHEAIRPTDINTTSCNSLGQDEKKLYELIWKRTVASQMTPAIYERRSAEFTCEKYVLSATGSKEIFDGFRKVWNYSSSEDKFLPDLKVGEIVDVIDTRTEEKKTQPPPHYSEASFIKELEKLGIGRPSTYATIPKTLEARKYISIEKKNIVVTELGINVSDFLIASNFCFIDINFTSQMEDKLDEIANGKLSKLATLKEFWDRLKSDIENAKGVKTQLSATGLKCPKCAALLLKKHSKWGDFYGCSNYGNKEEPCNYTAKIGEHGEIVEKVIKEKNYSNFKCDNCGKKLLIRVSKKGNEILGCEDFAKNKNCAGFYDVKTGEKIVFKKKKFFKKFGKKKNDEESEEN